MIAIPSRGRLRDEVLRLLGHAGYTIDTEGFIEMRPADGSGWLRAGRITAAFTSTDLACEHEIDAWPAVPLGVARSDLVVAVRSDSPIATVDQLAGATVATHLPASTERFFAERKTAVAVVAMGGALEGVCAAGLADAIVDNRETGDSLARHGLRAIEVIRHCEGTLVYSSDPDRAVNDLVLRLRAALQARTTQYLLLHIAPDRLPRLGEIFPGMAAPTVIPLAARDDLVAAHLVVDRSELWARLGDLRAIGASGIVALPTDAIVP